jgi:hypothetical protein
VTFEQWLKARGLEKGKMDEGTLAIMRDIFKNDVEGKDERARLAAKRAQTILGTAQAAAEGANDKIARQLLAYATDLVRDDEVSAEDAPAKITDKVRELMSDEDNLIPAPAPGQQNTSGTRELPAITGTGNGLTRSDIVDIFGQERDDRALYRRAGQEISGLVRDGNMDMRGLFKDLEGKTARCRAVTDERGTVRTVTLGSSNVVIQHVMTALLNMAYKETPDITDELVTVVPSTNRSNILPEVEADDGVRRVKEGEPYPFFGTSERDVTTSHLKWGAALGETRENSIMDDLGRMMVSLVSLSRQLRRNRANFRLARICDSASFDGRYIGRPGNSAGSSAFYSSTEDHRGNVNLKASNGLADYTDIGNVVNILEEMQLKDGTFAMGELKVIMVPSALKATAWKIINSLYCPPTGSDTANPMQVNPYGPEGMYSDMPKVLSHPAIATYTGNATTWFAGDPSRQFFETEIWGPEVMPKVTGGEMAIRDIVNLWIGSFCIDLVALSNMFFVKSTA